MVTLFILIITEIFSYVAIRQHFYEKSWMRFYFFLTNHIVVSIWLWILYFEGLSYNGIFDEPAHLWVLLNFGGIICGVVIPRIIFIFFHFLGVFANRKRGVHKRSLTNAGLIFAVLIFLVVLEGTLVGRFNFRTERVTVKIKGLSHDLEGLKIVQISDLHLSSFYHNKATLAGVMDKINKEHPDILINTGDFVTYGWREFDSFDTILRAGVSKYGNFAIMGNHDFGSYDPFYTEADRNDNVLLMHKKIISSGYRLLNDEFSMLRIGNARIAMIGVTTRGSFTKIKHGDLTRAISGIDSADLKILLAHDPNQWDKDVTGKTDINLTFSGHTHGMQMGIMTKKFRWSPARFFYPRWNGLYREGDQFLYVNRGLGVLGIPFRIWMPPEITVITLVAE